MARRKNQQQATLIKIADELDAAIRERLVIHGIMRPNLEDDLQTDLQKALEDEVLAGEYRVRVHLRELIQKAGA